MNVVPDRSAVALDCRPMQRDTVADARRILASFLGEDPHYRASAKVYGDGGMAALDRALELFLARPEIGFVWLAFAGGDDGPVAVGACVVCHAVSTSCGALVAKLDDVTIAPGWRGRGVGSEMLAALAAHLRGKGLARLDTACHRDNAGAWRFYERQGFRPLDEERIARLI